MLHVLFEDSMFKENNLIMNALIIVSNGLIAITGAVLYIMVIIPAH